jgi:hypothetical protein
VPVINGTGGVVTTIVLLVILQAKFMEGAWVVVLLIPTLALAMMMLARFYSRLKRQLNVSREAVIELRPAGESRVPVVVPVEEINMATVMALGRACEQSSDVTAVHVSVDPDEPSTLEERWPLQFPAIPLVLIDSPYRTVADPVAAYVLDRVRQAPHEVSVILPVVEPAHWYERLLVNQSMTRLQGLLSRNRRVTVDRFALNVGSRGRSREEAQGPA